MKNGPEERGDTAPEPLRQDGGGAFPKRQAAPRTRGRPESEGAVQGHPRGEAAAGPLVRPYTMTKGRTRPDETGPKLEIITTVVTARDRKTTGRALEPEQEAIIRLCRSPMSVAEVSARLDIPLTVVKVLLADLVADGDVRTRAAVPMAQLPEKRILQAVLDGIRRL